MQANHYEFDETAIIVPGEGGIGEIFHYAEGKYALHQRAYRICVHNAALLPKFLYYIMRNNFKHYIAAKSVGATATSIRKPMLAEFKIPLPPLPLQARIVEILDQFTACINALNKEHTLRKKQYAHYRDLLLSEAELSKVGFEWKTLGKVCLPTKNIKWQDATDDFQYIDLASVDLDNRSISDTQTINAQNAPSRAQKLLAQNDVIFATTRPTQMRVAVVPQDFDEQIASTGYCVLRADTAQILPKWIYFNLSTADFTAYLEEHQSGTAYPAISDGKIKDFKILDRFDTLTNSITQGIPREIELRRKQYEYYRELLLTFE